MILPNKHIELDQSLLGVGAVILRHLDKPRSITGLWREINTHLGISTFERFTIALDFLYAIGAIQFEDDLLQRQRQ